MAAPRRQGARWLTVVAAGAAVLSSGGPAAGTPSPSRTAPSLVLLTLDTTRADHVGPAPGRASLTPSLDALAARGTRYARALTPSPLTLPAHSSLLTGLDPPFHGVRDNGIGSLPSDLPTLATVLAARGYATGAFVSSRVLDRRFGLARGFAVYDDRMVAERTGEQGYPERDAEAVTTAALAWVRTLPPGRPYFLWVHYYDPHAPYQAPGSGSAPPKTAYAREVAYMDREIGRLLAALPGAPARRLVAAVGDHGEMLGEHGEPGHGIFLYRAALEVPLILAGPDVPAGRSVEQAVGTRALPATLLRILGVEAPASAFGDPLPGLVPGRAALAAGPSRVYSETLLPATAYGWSPLKAVSDDRWRYIVAPRPELYDVAADPTESRNLASDRPEEAQRLRGVLEGLEHRASPRQASPVSVDPQLAESLRSLGYHSGPANPRTSGMDPKDGIVLLAEFEQAKEWLRSGRSREAEAKLDDLVRRSPGNVPFLSRLAEAQVQRGRGAAAVATLKHAAALNPGLDFLHARLAEAYFRQGQRAEARAEYEIALQLNPRYAQAWMGLAEIALRAGRPEEERGILQRGEAAGTESAVLLSRLAQVELAAGELAAADRHAAAATTLVPDFDAGWWIWGEVAHKRHQPQEALARFERAAALGLSDPGALLRLGRLLLERGRGTDARRHLERAVAVGRGTPAGQEAWRLLQSAR